MLAASLGWNVIQKVNRPITVISRDGTQRNLPTNTSIRMSVFQSALSTIMVHTERYVATPELIDAIAHEAKIDRDHQRRLRLAIGEMPEEHRQRLANEQAAQEKRQPDEHLTHHPEITGMGVETVEEVVGFDDSQPPHDGRHHGRMVSCKPFIAHHTTSGSLSTTYVSDTSNERVWSDGYKDYECQFCGKVYGSPKGVGAHHQVHTRRGEVVRSGQAYERGRHTRAVDSEWVQQRRPIPVVEDLVFEEPPPDLSDRQSSEGMASTPGFGEIDLKPTGPPVSRTDVIGQIAALVAPQLIASRDMWKRMAQEHEQTIDSLQAELGDKTAELEKLRADWDALKGLIDGR